MTQQIQRPRPWFEDFFHGLANELWRRAVSPEQTAAEVAFLVRELRLHAGARVLDAPCGFGRHALALAAAPGCDVDGVDISAAYVAEATAAAVQRGPGDVRIRRGDMRRLAVDPGAYDAAYCLGNSFGYGDQDDSRAFLAGVAAALRPGGRFALETATAAESLLTGGVRGEDEHRLGDLVMRIENRYDAAASRLDSDMTFTCGDVVQRATASHHVHTAAELLRMLRDAGLHPRATYGTPDGDPYTLGSPRLLVVAERTS